MKHRPKFKYKYVILEARKYYCNYEYDFYSPNFMEFILEEDNGWLIQDSAVSVLYLSDSLKKISDKFLKNYTQSKVNVIENVRCVTQYYIAIMKVPNEYNPNSWMTFKDPNIEPLICSHIDREKIKETKFEAKDIVVQMGDYEFDYDEIDNDEYKSSCIFTNVEDLYNEEIML